MQMNKPLFVVICDHEKGPYVSETDVSRMDEVSVCKDLRAGQYSNPMLVIEINPIAHFCRDATHDFEPLFPDPDRRTDDD
jgi:hypothetical protein